MSNSRFGPANPTLRMEIIEALDEECADAGRLLALTACGGVLAALGFMQQNVALLAAAIFFTPAAPALLSLALALARADLPRLVPSLLRLVAGALIVLVPAIVVGVVARAVGFNDLTASNRSLLFAPAQPTVLSAVAALAVGALAAYALLQPRLPGPAVDAAVAAVLLPSPALVGLGLALRQTSIWHAALWQVAMNGTGALLAATIFFLSAGYRPAPLAQNQPVHRRIGVRRLQQTRHPEYILLLPVVLVFAVTLAHGVSLHTSAAPGNQIATTTTATPTTSTSPVGARATIGPTATPVVVPSIALTVVGPPTPIRAGSTAVITGTHGLGANLRKTAGMTAVIAVLPDGTKVTLTGKHAEKDGFTWVQVRTAAGQLGWVSNLFLQAT
jgi:uncharacterized membrane protein